MTVTVGEISFDTVSYDREADVLYLHVGDPSTAVDFDETHEGHGVRFGAHGEIVGLTVIRPKHLLETVGEVRITLPVEQRVAANELETVLR
jgi:uncharacterized protein YuzE